jgi:hypothetical protein
MEDPAVRVIGINHLMCSEILCPPVIGGVIVYVDYNHLTATFSRSLAPYLEVAMKHQMVSPGG